MPNMLKNTCINGQLFFLLTTKIKDKAMFLKVSFSCNKYFYLSP